MSADLSKILGRWPYESGQLNVRLIEGDDGEPRIQLRVDLGILQMRTEGRPDGLRPMGHESLLEYHEQRLDEVVAGEGSAATFVLNEDECRELREEAVQYYHRYVCLLALEDFEGVIRDTTRNLRVIDLCVKYAETEADRTALEQYRPYITMMRARALASQALKDNEPKAAIHAIDQGLDALKSYFSDSGRAEAYDESAEVRHLRGMRDALIPKLPVSQKGELRQRLAQAIEEENYELAAILRDELKMLDTGEGRA
ncbi:MAG: UvrB/UvrC motif-containing protein [Phycisphaeraceae bacterium]|nr:UvrB/UvrC motif-containing protein [Phycisphaeraceae bacterium]